MKFHFPITFYFNVLQQDLDFRVTGKATYIRSRVSPPDAGVELCRSVSMLSDNKCSN
jgi:hypothetical protein